MEIWGGIECSINRVGEQWFNQLRASGHADRCEDLQLIAELGLKTLRYPVLWEATAPRSPAEFDYSFADERLGEMQRLKIVPIVGLLHHGSGPCYTSLLDPNFPRLFADYALKIAQRFPWVIDYTPINEPLTTARFSGLYGHWYPHRRDDRSFVRILMNECRATVLAMQAIRRVNAAARLVQTEDLGTTYSTAHLTYQRNFDNERRWLTWDLLTGRVRDAHPLKAFLLNNGASEHELAWLADQAGAPQLIGINHYVTSDRYLDHRITQYPSERPGSNAFEPYVDIEAVRALAKPSLGWQVIQAAWARYRLPVAVTEVHLGCTPDEQLRWFNVARHAALQASSQGCDVRALTAWSLFGSFHWDRLLRDQHGRYEAGAFDVSSGAPQLTPLAAAIRFYTQFPTGHFSMPGQGWWQRPERLHRHASESLGTETVERQPCMNAPNEIEEYL